MSVNKKVSELNTLNNIENLSNNIYFLATN
jgi:hypothetical protein